MKFEVGMLVSVQESMCKNTKNVNIFLDFENVKKHTNLTEQPDRANKQLYAHIQTEEWGLNLC